MVTAVTLTGLCLVLRLDAAIHAERAADIVALGEPAMAVTTDIPFIPFVGFDEFAFCAHARRSRSPEDAVAWAGWSGPGCYDDRTVARRFAFQSDQLHPARPSPLKTSSGPPNTLNQKRPLGPWGSKREAVMSSGL
jgi:hypothetical protein